MCRRPYASDAEPARSLTGLITGTTHTKLPEPKRGTILDVSYSSITHERCQRSHRTHKTMSWRPSTEMRRTHDLRPALLL